LNARHNYFIQLSLSILLFSTISLCALEELPDSTHIFYLGQVVIWGDQSGRLSPFRQNIVSETEMADNNIIDASRAIGKLPGLTISNVGGRNESMVFLRGYDLRQVPVFIDGIPEYIPYDGYVDLARFTTFDLSEISVSKGFSSVLFGANAMGGAINLVSRKPSSQWYYDLSGGVANSGGTNYSLSAGSKQSLFYLMTNVSSYCLNSFPLSESFTATSTENGGERENSYRKDAKYSLKMGVTPNQTDEYSFTLMNQQGEKGNPIFTGSNPSEKVRFWRWPDWDKISQYFITRTVLGDKESTENVTVKTRFFHDKFNNTVKAYDNATYSSQTSKSAFTSIYDDDTWGMMLEAGTRYVTRHRLTFASHYKHDIHREHNIGEPLRYVRDATISAGIEDAYQLFQDFTVIAGISYDLRRSLQAQDYNSKTKVMSDFPKDDAHAWNAQLGGIYDFSSNRQFSFSIARKTRFATMKDRYSYKLGTAIPNPFLIPERAVNYDVAYSEIISPIGSYKVGLFFNDIDDAILQVSNASGVLSQMHNFGKAHYYGIELELDAQPFSFLRTGANYTYLKRKNISNPNVQFLDTPEHSTRVYAILVPFSLLSVTGSMEYNSERNSTSDGKYQAGAFSLFDLTATMHFIQHIDLDAGIRNIFDRNYYLVEGYPEAGRAGYLTLRLHD